MSTESVKKINAMGDALIACGGYYDVVEFYQTDENEGYVTSNDGSGVVVTVYPDSYKYCGAIDMETYECPSFSSTRAMSASEAKAIIDKILAD